ncbi:MAG: anaerobic ribonucleoside-triphosphate reductase, partial [Spirochaetaceae bacterium]|nr:anaerobic ribonucleoside-triphosphate reductase [Spirochaetaceae bacterium]
GLVGMHECCLNFLGAGIETDEGRSFALEVLARMRTRLAEYQVRTGALYNLEATPAESTSYRLAKHDRKRWPDIAASGAKEPYYTNSSQLPVGYTSDIFDALDHQEEIQASYTGGTVFHAFLGEAPDDWRAVRDLVRAIAANYRVPYYTISPTFSICPVHGYLAGEHFSCPRCKAETEARIRGEIEVLEKELAGAR